MDLSKTKVGVLGRVLNLERAITTSEEAERTERGNLWVKCRSLGGLRSELLEEEDTGSRIKGALRRLGEPCSVRGGSDRGWLKSESPERVGVQGLSYD